MKAKAIVLFQPDYMVLSERLREELELKIVKLYTQNRFSRYSNKQVTRFGNATKRDFLCAYLLSEASENYVLSGKLLQGIKIWFNMYYDDRLSVINKFRTCYQNVISPENVNEKPVVTIAFCKFLVCELLDILAESRWQTLIHYAD